MWVTGGWVGGSDCPFLHNIMFSGCAAWRLSLNKVETLKTFETIKNTVAQQKKPRTRFLKSAGVAALRVKCRFTVCSDRQLMLKISFYGFTAVHVGLSWISSCHAADVSIYVLLSLRNKHSVSNGPVLGLPLAVMCQ